MMKNRHIHTLPFGAQMMAPDRTRFRLWAPDAESVSVELDSGASIPMKRGGDGWLNADVACSAGTRYFYQVQTKPGNVLKVPDPASRAQSGDVHDASIVVDPASYEWRHADWTGKPWHETVLYELHVGACGGFAGVEQRLPDLAKLGITAVELMPIADFPGPRNWGYDGALQFAPDAAYGTPDQLKSLIDTAHGLGIMVFLDVVYNHFGPDGNYLGVYASPFFRDDIHTPWGQAIDFRRREVSDFYVENALYWLREYRFDGLRLDAVHAIIEQDWLPEFARRVRAGVEPGRHVHLVLEHEGNAASLLEQSFDAQWNDDGHHALHVLLTGERDAYYEDYAEEPAAKLARCLAEGFVYQGEPSPHRNGRPHGEPSAHLPTTAFVLFLQNHDQVGNRAFGERLTSLARPAALRAAQALLLLAPQIPLLFMGEEFGATRPFLYFTSHPVPELAEAVRDGRRREFSKFEAFSSGELRMKIPDPNATETFIESVPDSDRRREMDSASAAWLDQTGALLALRRSHIVPRLPGTKSIGAIAIGPAAVTARWRMGDGRVLAIAVNFDDTAVAMTLDAISSRSGTDLLFETENTLNSLSNGQLPAYGFIAMLEPSP